MRKIIFLALAGLLTACVQKPVFLYQWEGYPTLVYNHLTKGEEVAQQSIQDMEAGLQKIRAGGGKVPPGYYAHLGLLYLEQGKGDQARQAFESEKAAFPEFGPYMDFLLKKKTASGS